MTKSQYDLINKQAAPYQVGGRTKSAALLAWFLEDVWRLEDDEAETAICDGGGDKGIDGLVVDDDSMIITLLQSKYRNTATNTQGDTDLQRLVGAAMYFQSPETVDALLASKPNEDLQRLIRRSEIRQKLEKGEHSVRLVYVTNALTDASADDYLAATDKAGHPIDMWDRTRLADVASRTKRPDLRPETVTLNASAAPSKVSLVPGESIAVAFVPAKQLVTLPGIADLTLFARNVRLSAGRTAVNRDLAGTVRDSEEHALFAAYHNGITVLTHGLTVKGKSMTLDAVGVVNGCQSLIALSNNSARLTDDLLVLVKVVEVTEDSDVADKITFRSNNQNGVTMRDQRSTEPAMRDLQGQVRQRFGAELDFLIRVGETPQAKETLDNTTAAQLITAVYLREPYAAVRKVKLFDEEFWRIFNKEIDADKLYLLHLIDKTIRDARAELRDDLRAAFASIRFTLAYLTREVIELSDDGKRLFTDPGSMLPTSRDFVQAQIAEIVSDVILNVNFHVADELEDDPTYDPKSVFKSRTGVSKLQQDVLKSSKRSARKDQDYTFKAPKPPAVKTKKASKNKS